MADAEAEAADPRLPAAVELMRRTGATSVQIRFSDDEEPVVWMAVVEYGPTSPLHRVRPGGPRWEAAGAMSPLRAVFRLCDALFDGGQCQHCKRPTGFAEDVDPQLLEDWICWYQWDPELSTFRRGCEGGDR